MEDRLNVELRDKLVDASVQKYSGIGNDLFLNVCRDRYICTWFDPLSLWKPLVYGVLLVISGGLTLVY